MKPSPSEAAALFKLDLLAGEELVHLAGAWLEDGLGDIETACLAGEQNPTLRNSGAAFIAVLRELSIELPARETAVKSALELYLRRIVDGVIPPYEGMRQIDDRLMGFYPDDESPLCFFPRRDEKVKYVGERWGLERMYTWYRELQDAADGDRLNYYNDLPKAEAVEKFKQHLYEEAGKALDRLTALD